MCDLNLWLSTISLSVLLALYLDGRASRCGWVTATTHSYSPIAKVQPSPFYGFLAILLIYTIFIDCLAHPTPRPHRLVTRGPVPPTQTWPAGSQTQARTAALKGDVEAAELTATTTMRKSKGVQLEDEETARKHMNIYRRMF